MSGKANAFKHAGTQGTKMLKLSEALVGTEKKPGILSAITEFSKTLKAYSEMEKGGFNIEDTHLTDVANFCQVNI